MTPAEYLLYANTALATLALLGHLKGYFSSGEKTLSEKLTAIEKTLSEKLLSIEKKMDERLSKAESKLIEYDRRIQAIEGEIKHLPDRSTTHRMELAMSEINGKLNVMAERLKPIEAIGERLQETLMEQARK